MASNTKKTTVKTRRAVAAPATKKVESKGFQKEAFDTRKLLAVPLLALTAYCAYISATNPSGFAHIFTTPYAILTYLPFPALFVGAFSGLASYMLLKGRAIGKLAMATTWLFIAISLWLALVWVAANNPGSDPQQCPGLFGSMQNCADVTMLQAYILFLTPFSLAFYSLLALAGICTMTARFRS